MAGRGHRLVGGLAVVAAAAATIAGCASSVGGSGSAASGATHSSGPSTVYRTVTNTVAPPSSSTSGAASASSSSSGAPPTMPSRFVGTWGGHGRTLTVSAGGAVAVTYRTYVNCTATVTTDCDKTVGNEIEDGGSITAQLSQVVNPTTIVVTVTASTPSSKVPLGSARIGFDQAHDAIALFAGYWANAPFCGASAPSGYCGA